MKAAPFALHKFTPKRRVVAKKPAPLAERVALKMIRLEQANPTLAWAVEATIDDLLQDD